MVSIYSSSFKHSYTSDTLIFKENSNLQNIFIVLKGRLSIVKKVELSAEENIHLEIDRLETGNLLGDYCFILKAELPYSVVSIIPCDLLEIPIDVLRHAISDNDLEKMISCLKIYPPEEDLRRIYHEKKKWSMYMKDLINDFNNKKKLDE